MRISDWIQTCALPILRSCVEAAATEYGSDIVLPLDVSSDEQIDACFTELGKHWTDGFDILVHCIAYAPREANGGRSEARRVGKQGVRPGRSRWSPSH